ncbi:MAG: NIPSNAP family protein [Pseudomonadota bacterium]|nr:NIPSNAP family protein [Pseudomonadota bacterium]
MARELFRRAGPASAAALVLAGMLPMAAAGESQQPVVHQLRIYEIFDDNKAAFHDRFRNDAMRIMARYDFQIVAMWETQLNGRTEFVYLLQWPDRATLTDRWARFMADQEWADIKKRSGARHGKLVGDIEDRVLTTTDSSPSREFQRPIRP